MAAEPQISPTQAANQNPPAGFSRQAAAIQPSQYRHISQSIVRTAVVSITGGRVGGRRGG